MDSTNNFFYFWKIPSKHQQLKNLGLEKHYNIYAQRLYQGYLSTFAAVFVLIHIFHIILLWAFAKNAIFVDAILYSASIILILFALYLVFQKNFKEEYFIVFIATIVPLLLLAVLDLIIPWYTYYIKNFRIRPSHGVYIITAIYMYLPIFQIHYTICLGFVISAYYLIILGFISSEGPSYFIQIRFISEIIFYLSMNFFGMYFRLLREIGIIEVFYDRFELIKQTVMLKIQKDQEKHLLVSIIPANTADDLVVDIRNRIRELHKRVDAGKSVKNFKIKPEKLYVYLYHNVSILYADIVNFTYLTTTLEVKPLVKTLHELFVKFDEAAVEHSCLRIKFLGDCYYCVSGIPEKNEDHAKNCIDLGLHMIRIIRDVRLRRKLNIDMRIGIHSGDVFAGIIGLTKWQYDIWSRDVEIANTLESTGIPGRVHVSRNTLEKLNNEYYYEAGTLAAKENEFLIKNEIKETYLIIPHGEHHVRKSGHRSTASVDLKASNMPTNLLLYQEVQEQSIKEMDRQFKHLKTSRSIASIIQGWLKRIKIRKNKTKNSRDITRLSEFQKYHQMAGYQFWSEPDVLLKYSVLISLLIFFAITLLIGINNPINELYSLQVVVGCSILLFWTILLWYKKIWYMIWNKYTDSNIEIETTEQYRNVVSNFIYNFYELIITSLFWRLIIYFVVISTNFCCVFISLKECRVYKNSGKTLEDRVELEQKYKVCLNSWYITEAVMLARCVNLLFLRIPFLCKFLVDVVIVSFYTWCIFSEYAYVYEFSSTSNYGLEGKYAHLYVLLLTFTLFNLMERETENFYISDYNWKRELVKKKKESEISRATSKLLIENILPAHIVEIYISRKITNGLYTEKYDNVAVMFATIRNYDIEDFGLPVLDKIICDFDEKLTMYSGSVTIEKIKVIGLTYMAACGLNPGINNELNEKKKHDTSKWTKVRRNMVSNDVLNEIYEKNPFLNVFTITEFALELMKTLHKFNTEYYSVDEENKQVYVLRIGISHGEVMAGIVGSSKPLYDIWGNTVNMASRMDSTGENGKIQVTEETALVLQSFDIHCGYRGKTFVKGRNYIPTYFVGIDEDFELIPIQQVLNSDRFQTAFSRLNRLLKFSPEKGDTEMEVKKYD